MKNIRITIIICLLTLIPQLDFMWAADEVINTIKSTSNLHSAEEAINMALSFTNFDSAKIFSHLRAKESADLVIIDDDKTPFLHNQINGKSFWKIEFSEIDISSDHNKEGDRFSRFRNFTVYLNEKTGQLTKIHSIAEGYDPKISPLPSAKKGEEQLNHILEKYHGFPNNAPKISFLQALDKTAANPLYAGEIYAYYILESSMDSVIRPVWIIDLRGLPQMHTLYGQGDKYVPENRKNHLRTLIDAETGITLFTDNYPQSE